MIWLVDLYFVLSKSQYSINAAVKGHVILTKYTPESGVRFLKACVLLVTEAYNVARSETEVLKFHCAPKRLS